jgi:hypothetical protein
VHYPVKAEIHFQTTQDFHRKSLKRCALKRLFFESLVLKPATLTDAAVVPL